MYRLFICSALVRLHRNVQNRLEIFCVDPYAGVAAQRLILVVSNSVRRRVLSTPLLEDKLLLLQRSFRELGLAHVLAKCRMPSV